MIYKITEIKVNRKSFLFILMGILLVLTMHIDIVAVDFLIISNCYAADSSEEDPFADTEDDWSEEEPALADEDEMKGEWTYYGFIEFESVINTDEDLDFSDAVKKNEIRLSLKTRYGTDATYLFAEPNIYIQPAFINTDSDRDYLYADDADISRNLRLSSRDQEITLHEFYINHAFQNYRLRVGNQVFPWGTADTLNPTSYFSPLDLRELLFRDDDEFRLGVPSLSGMAFLGDYTLELVVMPVHIPMERAPNGTFWWIDSDSTIYTLDFEETDGMDTEPANAGFGARLSKTYRGIDFSLSGYRGPDRQPLYRPVSVVVSPNAPVSVRIDPEYDVIHMIGFDCSMNFDDFVVQVEAAYSPDKPGLVDQNTNSFERLIFPFETKTSGYLSYAAGFNYFIPLHKLIQGHGGNTVFTFEWFQALYADDGLYDPYLTDLVTLKFEDSYYSSRINVSVTTIFDVKNNASIIWPEIGYDFQTGLSIELSFAAISGERGGAGLTEPVLYYFKDNDIVMSRIRYEF